MSLELLETRRVALQADCDSTKDQLERNRLGQFATPPPLAVEILRHGLSLLSKGEDVRFLDPAVGTGSFFSALLKTARIRRIAQAVGFEIDPLYAKPARDLWTKSGLEVRAADFTKATAPESDGEKFNLLICNPPYVRHHHLDADEKHRLRAVSQRACGAHINGLAGLYCYFMGLAHPWMAPGALAGWLVPSEFMDVNYGHPVKDYLLSRVTLLRIHRFDPNEVQFGDALVSSAIVWFRNATPTDDHSVEFTFGGSLAQPRRCRTILARQLRAEPKWTRLTEPHRQAEAGDTRLGVLFAIKRGLATGANEFFVLNPEQIKHHRLPRQFLRPILPGPRFLPSNEIAADELGHPILDRRLFLLDCRRPESEVEARFPALWAYYEHGRAAGFAARYLCAKRTPWYAQENRLPTQFLCTYIGRSDSKTGRPFRFILNHSQAIAANVYLMLYPRPALAEALQQDPRLARILWQKLNQLDASAITREGRVYGGGLHKVEPSELANVPVDEIARLIGTPQPAGSEQLILCDGP